MKASILAVALAPMLVCSCRPVARTPEKTGPEPVAALRDLPPEQLHVFLKGYAGDWRKDTDRNRGIPPPPIEKTYSPGTALIDLVKPDQLKAGSAPLARVINQRRSRRTYTPGSLTNEELSFLLWSTQGISRVEKDEKGQIINQFRTVPSAGARHPFETYLAINRVDGIQAGVYRYLPVEHKLLWVCGDKNLPDTLVRACYGQKHVGEAAVVFIWTAIPYRTEWAYGYLAPKLIAVDAGHVCQNLYLAAESLGAGACAIMGYDQDSLDRLVGADGRTEFTVYLASVGRI